MTADDARLIAEAAVFAARAHRFQRRDDTGDAYMVHLAEVAAACARHEPFDAILVAAAYLHDTVEDTEVTEKALRAAFGETVTEIVLEVTDPPGLKGKARRERQVSHTATASDRAKLIKIADKTSNLAELVEHPRGIAQIKNARRYADWAKRVVDVCRGLDAGMEDAFDSVHAQALEGLAAADEGKKKKDKGR